MLLMINSERREIAQQMELVWKAKAMLKGINGHQRDIQNVRMLFELIERHMEELEQLAESGIEKGLVLNARPYLQANIRIKNHIAKKAEQLNLLAHDCRYQHDARQMAHSFAKIAHTLQTVQQKIMEFQRQSLHSPPKQPITVAD